MVELIYALSAQLPNDERFGLVQQLRRAAVSVPANIAEGHDRGATREFSRFLGIARGSLAEVETHIEVAMRLGMLDDETAWPAIAKCDHVGRILRGLRKSIDNKLAATSTHRAPATKLPPP